MIPGKGRTKDSVDTEMMESVENEKKVSYYVLYAPSDQQMRTVAALTAAFEGEGLVFCPSMEVYRRGREEPEIRALFPGYIFIRTYMDLVSIHEYLKDRRRYLNMSFRDLGYNKSIGRMSGTDAAKSSGYLDMGAEVSDLNEEESAFMDFLLGSGSSDADESSDAGGPYAGGPAAGLLRMSRGYREGSRVVVMEGPLKYYEDHIADVNMHDRKAYLDFKVKDRVVKAGLEIKPKKYWFPEETGRVVLEDGTGVDLQDMVRKMSGGARGQT